MMAKHYRKRYWFSPLRWFEFLIDAIVEGD